MQWWQAFLTPLSLFTWLHISTEAFYQGALFSMFLAITYDVG